MASVSCPLPAYILSQGRGTRQVSLHGGALTDPPVGPVVSPGSRIHCWPALGKKWERWCRREARRSAKRSLKIADRPRPPLVASVTSTAISQADLDLQPPPSRSLLLARPSKRIVTTTRMTASDMLPRREPPLEPEGCGPAFRQWNGSTRRRTTGEKAGETHEVGDPQAHGDRPYSVVEPQYRPRPDTEQWQRRPHAPEDVYETGDGFNANDGRVVKNTTAGKYTHRIVPTTASLTQPPAPLVPIPARSTVTANEQPKPPVVSQRGASPHLMARTRAFAAHHCPLAYHHATGSLQPPVGSLPTPYGHPFYKQWPPPRLLNSRDPIRIAWTRRTPCVGIPAAARFQHAVGQTRCGQAKGEDSSRSAGTTVARTWYGDRDDEGSSSSSNGIRPVAAARVYRRQHSSYISAAVARI
ncbi:hypothetical protein GALMADRAFT_148868 [Galerina marginata CBS 339.88]|uniref:Uncharacterized protein n=1 Tax=Galerina marginata (strain CBS 339.88) TaxID=685588 RepID=A0A067S356_GALM3|nr:hypothetical protein GALMADRAFT_148868 [Galerina marginata CBS 339.88]